MEPANPNRLVHFGVFQLDLHAGELRKRGLKIRLPHQSLQILACLLERPGEVVTREELRQELWSADTFVDFDMGLSSAVKKLRSALGDSAESPRFIETLPRCGYRFIGLADGMTEAMAFPAPAARRLPLRSIVSVTVAVIAVLAVLAGLNARHWRDQLLVWTNPPPIRSIAVLPLQNLTGDPAQEYFVDGMTDALITQLAQTGDLRVISRTSVIQYKEAKKPLPVIARELNVDGVVEGAVVRSGQRVRITAQLIDARTDRHLWARSYERDLHDVVALQAEVAQAIAEAVEVRLTPKGRARLPSPRQVNPEAHEAFLKGLMASSGQSYVGFRDAINYFEDSIAKQPDFATAYSSMSLCYLQFAFVGPLSPQEFMPKAEVAAGKALELDETLPEAHAVLGVVLYRFHWDWSGSEREFRRALALSPNYADGHRMFSAFLFASGRAEEAFAEAQRARELDPLSLQATLDLAAAFRGVGQYELSIAEFRKALEKDPYRPRAHFQLGATYVQKGELTSGIAELETAVNLSQRNPRFLAYLGYADAVVGKRSEAQNILEELDTLSRQQYVSPVGIALIHMGLGEKRTALTWLEKAYEMRDAQLAELKRDPRLDPLHSDPHFQDLVRRVGLAR